MRTVTRAPLIPKVDPSLTCAEALESYAIAVYVQAVAALQWRCDQSGEPPPRVCDFTVYPHADFSPRNAAGRCRHVIGGEFDGYFIEVWLGLSDSQARLPASRGFLLRCDWLAVARTVCHEVSHTVTGVSNDPRLSETAGHRQMQAVLENLCGLDIGNESTLRMCAQMQRFAPIKMILEEGLSPQERLHDSELAAGVLFTSAGRA